MFIGVAVNGGAIVVGSLLGRFVVKGIHDRFNTIILQTQGLFVIFIGIVGALECKYVLVLLFSLTIGGIIGEVVDIDKKMNRFGDWASLKFSFEGNWSKGFVTATLLFCTGSMAVVGAMQSGLSGNHNMLFMKSVMDGTIAVFLTSTLGIGVIFSFVAVLLYEGLIALGADFIGTWIDAATITEMSAAGSLLLIGVGINLLDIKHIKVANMIPVIFMPWPLLQLYEGIIAMI